jgi:hypothetical protein
LRFVVLRKFFDYFDLEGGKNIREVFKALQEKQKEQLKLKKPVLEQETLEEVQEELPISTRSGEEVLFDVDKKLEELSKKLNELDKEKIASISQQTEEIKDKE